MTGLLCNFKQSIIYESIFILNFWLSLMCQSLQVIFYIGIQSIKHVVAQYVYFNYKIF